MCLALLLELAGCVAEREEPEWFLQAGDALPKFEVVTLEGEKVTSSDSYKAEMVIVFFNTTCPDCRRELPEIQKQYEENQSRPESERDLYICISREEGAADVAKYWEENHLTIPVSAQPDRRVYSLFASIGIPRVFHARNGLIINRR